MVRCDASTHASEAVSLCAALQELDVRRRCGAQLGGPRTRGLAKRVVHRLYKPQPPNLTRRTARREPTRPCPRGRAKRLHMPCRAVHDEPTSTPCRHPFFLGYLPNHRLVHHRGGGAWHERTRAAPRRRKWRLNLDDHSSAWEYLVLTVYRRGALMIGRHEEESGANQADPSRGSGSKRSRCRGAAKSSSPVVADTDWMLWPLQQLNRSPDLSQLSSFVVDVIHDVDRKVDAF